LTVLIYVSKDAKDSHGGHTIFPTIPSPHASVNVAQQMTDVFTEGYAKGERSMSPYSLDGSGPADNSKKGGNWNHSAFLLMENECRLALTQQNNVLAVRPKKGMAVVFPSVLLDGSKFPDPLMWHAACHPIKGRVRKTVQKFKV
jgi:hypothetical protein